MDILETPGTRLTSVARLRAMRSQIRCVVTYVSTNTGSWRSRDYSPIYISRNQIFWRMGRARREIWKGWTGKKGRRFRVARRERERARERFGIRDDTTLFSQRSDRGNEFLRGRGRSQTFVYYVGRYRVSNAHDVAAMLTWPGVVAARKCQTSRPIRYSHAWKSRAKSIHSSI